MPAGKRPAPILDELVVVLRHFGELSIDEGTAALLASMCWNRILIGRRRTLVATEGCNSWEV
jgi:hypothetical protein